MASLSLLLIALGTQSAAATTVSSRITYLTIKQLGPVPYDVHEALHTRAPGAKRAHLLLDAGSSPINGVSWAPDAIHVVFGQADSHLGPCRIKILDTTSQQLDTIHRSHRSCDANPVWSPDGATILFGNSANLFEMATDGSGVTQLASFARGFLSGWDWSPTGDRIVFTRETSRSVGKLFVMNADGSSIAKIDRCATRLCRGGAWDEAPAWSPDGSAIAFLRSRNVYVIAPDGTDLSRITNCRRTYRFRACTASAVAWSPNSGRIAFSRSGPGIWVKPVSRSRRAHEVFDRGFVRTWTLR